MTVANRINGHDSVHALDELRTARCHYASAMHKAIQYLELARMVATTNALPYDTPRPTAIVDALDQVNRDLNGNAKG